MPREKLLILAVMTIAVSLIASETSYSVVTLRDIMRERVIRELPHDVSGFREICHEEKPGQLDDWCRGYIVGFVQGLSQNKDICAPKNSVGRVDEVAVWVIVRAWLFRVSV